jgi:hypothetical protein
MGYACPVCEEPQADLGHLANHVAFTAMTGGEDHEQWLDEHVSGWGQLGESELADELVELAEETAFPFDDVDEHDHAGHDHGHDAGVDTEQARARASGHLDDEAEDILREARELTEEMQEPGTDSDTDDETDESAGADETQ